MVHHCSSADLGYIPCASILDILWHVPSEVQESSPSPSLWGRANNKNTPLSHPEMRFLLAPLPSPQFLGVVNSYGTSESSGRLPQMGWPSMPMLSMLGCRLPRPSMGKRERANHDGITAKTCKIRHKLVQSLYHIMRHCGNSGTSWSATHITSMIYIFIGIVWLSRPFHSS